LTRSPLIGAGRRTNGCDGDENPLPNAVSIKITLGKSGIGTLRGVKLRKVAMPVDYCVGGTPDVAIRDHAKCSAGFETKRAFVP